MPVIVAINPIMGFASGLCYVLGFMCVLNGIFGLTMRYGIEDEFHLTESLGYIVFGLCLFYAGQSLLLIS
jgi:hypothetical protein